MNMKRCLALLLVAMLAISSTAYAGGKVTKSGKIKIKNRSIVPIAVNVDRDVRVSFDRVVPYLAGLMASGGKYINPGGSVTFDVLPDNHPIYAYDVYTLGRSTLTVGVQKKETVTVVYEDGGTLTEQ